MTRFVTAICLFIFLTFPLGASASWFGPSDGQCSTTPPEWAISSDVSEPEEGCDDLEGDDASSNACFEGAEYPVSTLPTLIAETYAERVTAQVVRNAARLIEPASPMPSPDEASVEDPVLPGVPLVKLNIPSPRPAPNACSAYPEECETAPWIPTLNFDGSVSQALGAGSDYGFPPAPDVHNRRRGPPNPGLPHADGVRERVERPPQFA